MKINEMHGTPDMGFFWVRTPPQRMYSHPWASNLPGKSTRTSQYPVLSDASQGTSSILRVII